MERYATRTWLQSLGWRAFAHALALRQANLSFAQEGEDLILARLFEGQRTGRFVDVGAHHPTRFSNTYLLYLRGWRGINIDPTPGSMKLFARRRPHDVNLEIAISDADGRARLHVFDEPALNTFDDDVVRDRIANGYTIVAEVEVAIRPLSAVLREHPGGGGDVELLTIDTEGHDLVVLRSADWSKFRPRVVCVESSVTSGRSGSDPSLEFLGGLGYSVVARTANSNILSRS